MTSAAQSVGVFGVYLTGTAVTLVVAPNSLLGLLGIAPTTEPWIRVLGIVVGALAAYYMMAARTKNLPFFRTSVWARFGVLAGFSALVVLGFAPKQIIGFGAVDAVGALWTWAALRSTGGI